MRIGAGRFKGRRLPRPTGARPIASRLRTSLFDHLGPRLEGAHVLDVCAGVGTLGLEALSRGAAHATFVELDRRQAAAIEAFLATVGAAAEATVLRADALRRLPAGAFDVVFVDPPFDFWDTDAGEGLVRAAAGRLAPGGTLVVKLPRERPLDPPEGLECVRRAEAAAVAALAFRRPLSA